MKIFSSFLLLNSLFLSLITNTNAFSVPQLQQRVPSFSSSFLKNARTRLSDDNYVTVATASASLMMTGISSTIMKEGFNSNENNTKSKRMMLKHFWHATKTKTSKRTRQIMTSLRRPKKEHHSLSIYMGLITACLLRVTHPIALAAKAVAAPVELGEAVAPSVLGRFGTLARRVLTVTKQQWKPILAVLVSTWMVLSLIESKKACERQSLDATSEWSRYAMDPAARGGAVMMITFRLLPIWLRQSLCKEGSEEKTKLRAESGVLFADELLKLGPLYIKLGQILSCRENLLPEEWISAMERLQDRVPAKSGKEALELAYSAMSSGKSDDDGREAFERAFQNFDSKPLAAASLGQVHRAELKETGERVAIKLQRPNLRQIYDQDLALLTKIATMVDKIPQGKGNVGGVSQSWTDIFADAKGILYREIDYRDEADNAMRFNRDFGLGVGGKEYPTTALSLDGEALPSAAPWLRAPHIYRKQSSEKLLVMEYVPSTKITNIVNITMEDREYLADSLARTYLRSFCNNRFFSTDPHPGNLGIEFIQPPEGVNKDAKPKPRLVMYDFGQACELQSAQAEGILTTIEAIVDMDADRCVTAFSKMGVLKDGANFAKVRAKVQDNFETGKITVKRKKLKKAGYKFKDELEQEQSTVASSTTTNTTTTTTAKVKDSEVMGYFTLPAEYAFVARALSQMDGVGKVLDPDFDFISSAAPYIVEIKGTSTYLQDEWKKWMSSVTKQFDNWKL